MEQVLSTLVQRTLFKIIVFLSEELNSLASQPAFWLIQRTSSTGLEEELNLTLKSIAKAKVLDVAAFLSHSHK